MKIEVHRDKCCGAGQCALVAPGVFDQREEDGIVVLLQPNPPADEYTDVRQAASLCPATAIHLVDD
jgi:ferredoxin